MARTARIVIPDIPHHVTQRGNRREPVFFQDGDQLRYLAFLKAGMEKSGTAILAYCLMPNHVHIIAVPKHKEGLRELFSEAHRRYTNYINWRHGWTGHLWQSRFGSVAMDEDHFCEALRYVCLNPVRAGLVKNAEDWAYSSVRAHLSGKSDSIIDVTPILERFPDFSTFLGQNENPAIVNALRQSESSGRPLVCKDWISNLEALTGASLQLQKRGRKFKNNSGTVYF